MEIDNEIEILKENYLSTTDKDRATAIGEKIIAIGGNNVYSLFTPILAFDNSKEHLRNRAAYILKKIGRNGALEPLFDAIFKEENIGHNAVMVDALYTHDCTYSLAYLFKILFYHTYDAKVAAYRNLMDHEFSFSRTDILELKEKWENLQLDPTSIRDYDISKTIIAEAVDKFVSYLQVWNKPTEGFLTLQDETEFLKALVQGEDSERAFDAVERLAWIRGDDVFSFFVSLLNLNNNQNHIRNRAATGLRNMGDDRAVDPLFAAAIKSENINYNGSLVYALNDMNCSDHFMDLFQILFYHGYEARIHAYSILCEQEFSFDKNDIIKVVEEWRRIGSRAEQATYSDDERQIIEDAIERYLPYLDEEDL